VYVDNRTGFDYNAFSLKFENDDIIDVTGVIAQNGASYTLKPRGEHDIRHEGITSIAHIQGFGEETQLVDEVVMTQGIVTGTFSSGYFIQDADTAWSGVYVYDNTNTPTVGDEVKFASKVTEYKGLTELTDVESFEIVSSGNTLPNPVVLSADVASNSTTAEQYEGVLVKIENVTVSDDEVTYGEWYVQDLEGNKVKVDNIGSYTYEPVSGDSLEYVQGPLNYSYGEYKIFAREDADLPLVQDDNVPTNPSSITIADVQGEADVSPLEGQTVEVTGTVTGSFEKGYFIQDDSSTWSGIYVDDSETQPSVGDNVSLSATVEEKYGLTQLTDVVNVTVNSSNNELPEPVVVTADILEDSSTAEQYEGVLLRVEDVTVTDDEVSYGEWYVTDGTGKAKIDNIGSYTYTPVANETLAFVQGPLNYSYSEYKLAIQSDEELGFGSDALAIADIQGGADASPYDGEIVTTKGIITATFDGR
jgi:predicted extracellular nuclease